MNQLSSLDGDGRQPRRNFADSGVALVIVLAFIVILTGLIVSFFSRSITSRQASNATSSQAKAELFARGTVKTIIGDLKQEIADGSDPVPIVNGTLYLPKQPINAMPELTKGISGIVGLENVVKRSANGQKFSSGANASNRASSVPTTTASQNLRPISNARWNTPLLMPAKSTDDHTPTLGNNQSFTPPDWILVARDGSNPIKWDNNMRASLSATVDTMVTGRYAYMIYDEGGLLDVNVAGYPDPASAPKVLPPDDLLPSYKGALAFADLTQLTDISGNPLLQQSDIDQIVGWRNYASATGTSTTPQIINTLPLYKWAAAEGKSNYYKSVLSNPTGFLTVSNSNMVNSKTDQMFTSRQSLIRFFMQTLQGGSNVKVQNALQYLTHFSREINQPSLAPDHSGNKNSYRTRPKVASVLQGGYDFPSGKTDDDINPSFLAIRVAGTDPEKKAFDRNKGTPAIGPLVPAYETDPLVVKRFPLSRLVWLTYKGPSQGRTGVDIDDLKNNLNVIKAMLDLGTAANVETYFGLTWKASGYWEYSKYVTGGGAIKTLKEVAAETPKREANFIELLKATILAGSIGKGGATKATAGVADDSHPVAVQNIRDTVPDNQIIQIAANIIDQADVDGYPTRIQYFNREFRGVENLPYLYRVRNAALKVENPDPMPPVVTGPNSQAQTKFTHAKTGTFVFVQQPEIWNPNSYDSGNPRTLGNPRPANFDLVAYSNALPALPPASPTGGGFSVWSCAEAAPKYSPTSKATPALNDTNTRMTFTDNKGALFREPTLLIKLGKPTNSNLQAPGFTTALQGANSSTGAGLPTGQSLSISDKSTAFPSVTDDGNYTGVYIGWNSALWDDGSRTRVATHLVAGNTAATGSTPTLLYQIRCDNPNGGSYYAFDEKFFDMHNNQGDNSAGTTTAGVERKRDSTKESTLLNNSDYVNQIIGWGKVATCFDPRTSRFGFFFSRPDSFPIASDPANIHDLRAFPPGVPGATPKLRWVDETNHVLESNRPDENAGYGGYSPFGAPPGQSLGWEFSVTPRYGMYSQNTRNIKDNFLRYSGDVYPTPNAKNRRFTDPDAVLRRGMGGYVPGGSNSVPANTSKGLPMATAFYATGLDPRQKESRPIVLNRPFRSVAELGYVFSDTPWRNLDFATPESGFAPLLDAFSINDTPDANGLIAGRLNLNTRQLPVVQAIVAGAYRDELGTTGAPKAFTAAEAKTIATALLARTDPKNTTAGKGPLVNVADLVGRWKPGATLPDPTGATGDVDGGTLFDGFSADLADANDAYNNNIMRYREGAIRALAATGQTRVWNLLIDVIAQTGRYPMSANNPEQFVVEGEQRLWVHLAIDRLTGKIVDQQIEAVQE
jgi:uncharacterized protein (DUF952 family)